MDNLISIIVPVYNVEKYINRCVDSILSQTYRNIEIILVDDGSTDSSGIICDKYATVDSRIKVFHTKNGGLSYARNIGIEASIGDYICFVDSDDWIEKNILELALEESKANDVDVVVWGFVKDFVDDNEVVKKSIIVKSDKLLFEKNKDSFALSSQTCLDLSGYAWNKLYKSSLIKYNKLKFEEGVSLVEDMLFNELALSKAEKVLFISNVANHYIQRNRATLGASFYPDFYELKIRACDARENLLKSFGIDAKSAESIILDYRFSAIISSCRMAYKTDMLSPIEKKNYVKRICYCSTAKDTITKYNVSGKNRIYYFIIKSRQFWLFKVLFAI